MKGWVTIAIVLGLINVAVIYLMAKEHLHQTELQLDWKIKELAESKVKYSKCLDECKILSKKFKTEKYVGK